VEKKTLKHKKITEWLKFSSANFHFSTNFHPLILTAPHPPPRQKEENHFKLILILIRQM